MLAAARPAGGKEAHKAEDADCDDNVVPEQKILEALPPADAGVLAVGICVGEQRVGGVSGQGVELLGRASRR